MLLYTVYFYRLETDFKQAQREQQETFEKGLREIDEEIKHLQEGGFKDCARNLQAGVDQLHQDVLQVKTELDHGNNDMQQNFNKVTDSLAR